ncbi:hypothetical protein ACOSP6_10845 [Tenacibaculum sp. MEBiC06402]|uniref:hypothetical protein n=1 Tax=unclassified Tenacibaculum TaxID=2635139 RepID=UPI003B99F647
MIFYGTKGAHLKSEKISGVKCSHCEQQTSYTASIFGRYAYLYWIPVFPLPKKGVAECDNCKVTLEPKQMNDQLRMKYDNVNANVKTPITYWIGSLILAAIIAFGIYSVNQHEKDVVEYIKAPQAGDVVEYKPSDFYSTLKITRVENDSVYFAQNKFEIEKQSRIYKIDKTENYTEEAYGISLADYQKKFDTKEFLDVER